MNKDKHLSVAQALLLQCLKKPETIIALEIKQWTLLIRMTKHCNLTAHLAWLIEENDLKRHVPEKVTAHFTAANTIVTYRKRLALWELNRLHRALAPLNLSFIVLKGGAYLAADIPFAKARLFADIDILVEKETIHAVEQALLAKNWQSQNTDEYDQNYYRQWMHEIPPLRHIIRSIEVDIHHTIIPPVSALQPDPALLIKAAIEIDNSQFKVLSPCDMILHSAVHLFFDSDLSNRLKDLVDLDQLLRHFFSQNVDFLTALILRAEELGLSRPLYYTFRYTQQVLETPIPQNIVALIEAKAAPNLMIRLLMDTLIPLAIMPEHPDFQSKKVAFSRWLLYVRSHYLRMPLKLLIPHLCRKSIIHAHIFFQRSKNA